MALVSHQFYLGELRDEVVRRPIRMEMGGKKQPLKTSEDLPSPAATWILQFHRRRESASRQLLLL